MLPFGLTTDVSAGALAAGSGGALGAANGTALSGNAVPGDADAGFVQELKAVTGQGAVQQEASSRDGLSSAAAEDALKSLQAAADEPLSPQSQPLAAGAGQAQLPVKGVSTQSPSVPFEETNTETPGAEEVSPTLDVGDISLAAMAPAHMGAEGPPVAGGSASAAAVSSGGGAVGAASSAAGVPLPAGTLPATPPAVPAATPGQAPLPAGATGAEVASSPAQPVSAGTPTTQPLEPAVDTPVPAPAPAGRRWQTELPAELRAPLSVPVKTGGTGAPTVETRLTAVATVANSAVAAPGQFGPLTTREGVPAQTSNVQVAKQPLADALPTLQLTSGKTNPSMPGAQAGQPGTGLKAGELATATQQSQPVTAAAPTLSSASPQAPSTVSPAQPSTAGAGVAQLAVEPAEPGTEQGVARVPSAEPRNTPLAPVTTAATGQASAPIPGSGVTNTAPAPAQAVASSGDVPLVSSSDDAQLTMPLAEDGSLPGKPAADSPLSANAAKPAGSTAGPANPETRQAALQPAAATTAAAAPVVAAALPVSDEAELPVMPLEAEAGTEFSTATVRGGEVTGAMRTESLQTPNQTQSAHVATQVAAEIARNLKNGQTQFQMRFDPPELGRVEVNMRVGSDGSVQAHLIVERPETLDMFLRDQRGLERALEAAGLSANSDNLQFSLKQEGGQDTASGQDKGNGSSGAGDSQQDGVSDQDPDLSDRVRLMLAEQRGGLDMKV